jgi:uncharacterized protein YeaO (DUF488 family)
MAIRVVQLGSPRVPGEGLRLGTARLLPRGVKKGELAKRNYFDVWLPELAPTASLVAFARSQPWNDRRWASFSRRYLSEMRRPVAQRLIELLAALSQSSDFSIGCYCADESRCHRSLLRQLLQQSGAKIVRGVPGVRSVRRSRPSKGSKRSDGSNFP